MSVWIRTSALATLIAVTLVAAQVAHARDPDGRYAASPLHAWFEQLASKKGRCCSDADGRALADVDWTSHDGHYRVQIDGEWVDVPDDALITEPNRAGPTMVWPTWLDGHPQVRCFMPGSMGGLPGERSPCVTMFSANDLIHPVTTWGTGISDEGAPRRRWSGGACI